MCHIPNSNHIHPDNLQGFRFLSIIAFALFKKVFTTCISNVLHYVCLNCPNKLSPFELLLPSFASRGILSHYQPMICEMRISPPSMVCTPHGLCRSKSVPRLSVFFPVNSFEISCTRYLSALCSCPTATEPI